MSQTVGAWYYILLSVNVFFAVMNVIVLLTGTSNNLAFAWIALTIQLTAIGLLRWRRSDWVAQYERRKVNA